MAFTDTTQTLTEIFTFTTSNGDIARWTPHDANVVYGGNTWTPIPISRTPIKYHANLQVDKCTITIGIVGITVGAGSLTIPQVVRRGFMRNAHVVIEVIDWVALGAPTKKFEGWVNGDGTWDGLGLTVDVGSLLDKLNEKFPKILYTEYCNHQLYGTYCTLLRTNFDETDTVPASPVSTAQTIYGTTKLDFSWLLANKSSIPNISEKWWKKGEIKFTGGNLNGISRTVASAGDGFVKLVIPFHEAPASTDPFTIYAGCNKSGRICDLKFSNYANFLGFEHIPKPKSLYTKQG